MRVMGNHKAVRFCLPSLKLYNMNAQQKEVASLLKNANIKVYSISKLSDVDFNYIPNNYEKLIIDNYELYIYSLDGFAIGGEKESDIYCKYKFIN